MFRKLEPIDYREYLEHVERNSKNSRKEDPTVVDKVKNIILSDPKTIIFAEFNSDGKIIRSVMTKKRVLIYEYKIINLRSSTSYFNMKKFLELFECVFNYYESIGYYRWVLARPLDLLNPNFFDGLYLKYPFSKYETAIEAISTMGGFDDTIYNTDLLSNIPDVMGTSEFVVISGFCKQEYRNFPTHVNKVFV